MSKKIPPDAFEHYMSLGPGRSYEAVAGKYALAHPRDERRGGDT